MITAHRLTKGIPECPCCKAKLDAATNADPSVKSGPKVGDISVCIYCGTWLAFDDDMSMRVANDSETDEIRKNPGLSGIVAKAMDVNTRWRDEQGHKNH